MTTAPRDDFADLTRVLAVETLMTCRSGAVGAAVHALRQTFDEQRSVLVDAGIDIDAAEAHIGLIRTELCADVPRRLRLAMYLAELAEVVRPVQEAADDVESLRTAVMAWLP